MSETNQQQISELQTLRHELGLYRFYVRDAELRSEIKAWIAEAQDKDAGTVQEWLRRKLMEMRSEYPMRWEPQLQRAAEGFPDSCEGCEHVKRGSCPVVTDRERRKARERQLSQVDTEQAARAVWEEHAVETGCQRIPEWLQEWGSEHEGFVQRGHRLLERVEDLTLDAEGDMERLPQDLQEVGERDDVMALGGELNG